MKVFQAFQFRPHGVGERCGSPRIQIDMKDHQFVGCGRPVVFARIHFVEDVQSLFIDVQDARADAHLFAQADLVVIGDVRLDDETHTQLVTQAGATTRFVA